MTTYLTNLTIKEISGVVDPAQQPAKINAIKSAEPDAKVVEIIKSATGAAPTQIEKFDRVDLVSSEVNGHVHPVTVDITNGRLDFIVYYAGDPDRPFDMHDHAVVKTDGGFELTLNEGHVHAITDAQVEAILNEVIANKSLDSENHTLASLVAKGISCRGLIVNQSQGESEMTDEEKAQMERLTAIVSLTAAEKSHFDGLDTDEAKNEFLAKSADDRAKDIAPVEEAKSSDPEITEDGDEITFTGEDGAVETVKKADNPIAFAALQAQQKAVAEKEKIELSKRAQEAIGGISKDSDVVDIIMKQLEGIADETLREKSIKAIQTQLGIAKVAGSLQSSEETEQGNALTEEKVGEPASKSSRKTEAEIRAEVKAENPELSQFDVNRIAFKKFKEQE